MSYFHSAKKDKDYIVTGSEDKSVRIWDVESGECMREIKAHKLRVKAVTVVECDDRIILCSVSSDGLIKCWDLEAALESEDIESLGEYNTKCRATCITSHVGFAKTEAIAAVEAAAEAEVLKEAKALKKAKDAAKKEAILEAKKAEKKATPPKNQKKKLQQQKKKSVAKK